VRKTFFFLLFASFLSACGGSSPSAPTAPPIAQYAGNWTGTYTITGCTQSGGIALANICGSLGNTPPYGLQLTQTGSNVSGSFTLGTVSFPNVGGTVGSDGSLALSGTSLSSGVTIVVTWALHMSSGVTGTLTQVWQSSTLSGQTNVVGNINTSSRSAFSLAPASILPTSVSGLAAAVARAR
jgi:hypothetical protein